MIEENKDWQEYALDAKKLAKKIKSMNETNENGEYKYVEVDRIDFYATYALKKKFNLSYANVHTYPINGNQIIEILDVEKGDRTFYSYTDNEPSEDEIGKEIEEYFVKSNNVSESKIMKKKVIRLTESKLRRLIREAIEDENRKNAIAMFLDMIEDDDEFPNVEDVEEGLRSLVSERDISEDDYVYIMENWYYILKEHGLL